MKRARLLILVPVLLALVSLPTAAAPLAGPCAPGAAYDPACDVNHDNQITITDIQLTAGHWNQSGTYLDDAWSLTGNAGTTPGLHFVGTTDNKVLQFKVNGNHALRLEPTNTTPNVIGGFAGNSSYVGVNGGAISGGGSSTDPNYVTDSWGTVGGGAGNRADYLAAVGGGYSNQATGHHSAIAGGSDNTTSASTSFVGAGSFNVASGGQSAVVSGWQNDATGDASFVGGGWYNTAGAVYSTVPGGYSNTASGYASFAAGYRAKAYHEGTFVLADHSDFDFASTTPNTLRARFTNGIRLVVAIDGSGGYTVSCVLNESTVTWACYGAEHLMKEVEAVDEQAILDKLSQLTIMTWRAGEAGTQHVGPRAEDFHALFGLGDGEAISTVDLDGVALAAIQALYQTSQVQAQENAALHDRIQSLEARLAALEASQPAE